MKRAGAGHQLTWIGVGADQQVAWTGAGVGHQLTWIGAGADYQLKWVGAGVGHQLFITAHHNSWAWTVTPLMQPDAVLLLNGDDQIFSSNFFSQYRMNSIDDYERWFGRTVTDKDQIWQIFGTNYVYPVDKSISIKIPSSSVLFYNSQLIDDTSINKKKLNFFFKKIFFIHYDQLNLLLNKI